MNLFKMLDRIKKKQSSLLIYCMLDRIPIIVFGDDEVKIDNFLINVKIFPLNFLGRIS